MATIQDPTGALSLWQTKTHIGIGIAGINGTQGATFALFQPQR